MDGVNALIPEKEGLVCGGGDVVVFELGKLRPLNASERPAKASCDCVGGCDAVPEEGCRLCGAVWAWAFGADEYRERIDCLRSGRDGAVEPTGLDEALEGRTGPEGGALPKKSSPSSESPCFVCRVAVGSALLGWALAAVLSVVLGRAGGAGGSSPNKSMVGGARRCDCIWPETDRCLCEADRSILAFSCTMLSGCDRRLSKVIPAAYAVDVYLPRRHRPPHPMWRDPVLALP